MTGPLKYGAAALLLVVAATALADTVIEEVVVVAQKREQSLQDIPFSISAVTGEEILSAGIDDVFDMATKVPSLEITQNAGPINTSFRIRRIGNEANIPNFEPAVGRVLRTESEDQSENARQDHARRPS